MHIPVYNFILQSAPDQGAGSGQLFPWMLSPPPGFLRREPGNKARKVYGWVAGIESVQESL